MGPGCPGRRGDAHRRIETVDATTLFIVGLFLLVACAVIVGEAMSRLGHLPLVGQLAVGIVFGPTLLGPFLGLGSLSLEFQGIQFLATFFILMTAGLAVTPEQVRATGGASGLLGLAIFAIPFLAGAEVVHLLYPGLPLLTNLFVSLTISITALPVLGVMLREFGLLEGRFGAYLLNGALVNELVAVTAFAVLLRVRSGTGTVVIDLLVALAAVGLFLSSVLAVHMLLRALRHLRAWKGLVARFRDTWRSREAGFAILMVAALGAALYSQYLGLTFLVGAFYAGLLVTPESAGRKEHRALTHVFDTITWGFFIPLFFALVGLGMNLRLLGSSWVALAAFALLCLFAFLAKFVVGGWVTRALGWSRREATGAGFLLASRGAVELAMAVILLSLGVFTASLFTVVAAVGLVTTVISPLGARPFVRGHLRPKSSPANGLAEFEAAPQLRPEPVGAPEEPAPS
jgi:Kef-type K+ transport system membrane component KefB